MRKRKKDQYEKKHFTGIVVDEEGMRLYNNGKIIIGSGDKYRDITVGETITRTEVKTFLVELECEKCNDGKLEYNGKTFLTNPLLYEHKCKDCGNVQTVRGKIYPYYDHEKI